jgi:hypothetical protein
MFMAVNSMAPWFACSSTKPDEIPDTKHKLIWVFKFEGRAVKYALHEEIGLAVTLVGCRPFIKLIKRNFF